MFYSLVLFSGNIENQSAIQSILDAQTVTENPPQGEDRIPVLSSYTIPGLDKRER